MTKPFDSEVLLHRLADEFKTINLPFNVKMVARQQYNVDLYAPGRAPHLIIIDINSECSEEEFEYVREFAYKEEMITIPMMNFENLRTAEYFSNEEDAFNFNMSLDIKQEKKWIFTINIGLEEAEVNRFMEQFRDKTEPLRLKAYETEFDEQVDNHCSNDGYNLDKDNNGHK